jgi:RNA polymerase sigma-70 factor, ECF subfamily
MAIPNRAFRSTGPLDDPAPSLLRRIAGGDEAALGELYDRTSSRVFGLALQIVRDRGAAEEVTLDVFTQVWREAGRYDRARGSPMSWLLTIARSRAIDSLRVKGKRTEIEGPLEGAEEFPGSDPNPEASATGVEREASVRRALGLLPKEQRRAIEAAFFGGLSHSEVAAAQGVPLGTIKTRIRTGLLTLRRQLSETGEATG